ncbi:hypothetical protein [Mameliella sediminis]|uniref:COG3904 family protein n=1 Tax=Mameliella sediminis TaxID=2836866 RepID=UPI001C477F6E|nr:hypothetical protein [Mameliella sediminis]MBV7393678.1 hypothetical protein [Mameliella sediminis]MBY6160922.1 hypothetical protein [Mameliella alba]MBY6169392.1 hypothetical protein [Mameliella alba]MBY6174411.1 hypothetical protein [Mameliella alba]
MFRFVLLAWAALVLPAASHAAQLALVDDAEFGCLITLDGEIADGDTERLLELIRRASTESRFADTIWYTDYPDAPPDIDFKTPLNLCLNSPGGSLAAAVSLTEAVHGRLGTMIRPGARCESACALVFMAGAYNTASDIGIIPSRHLHVDGRLGFHAPSLTVPQGNYDAETVARAYQISVAATSLIFRNLVKFRFAPSLAAKMHDTPPQEMFYITTVREAARWGISVLGIDAPSPLSDAAIRTACANLYLSTTDRLSSNPDDWYSGGDTGVPVTRRNDGTFSFGGFGMEALGFCEGRFIDPADEFSFARQVWGPARAVQETVWAGGAFPEAEPPLFYAFMQHFMAYPPEMPLAALPRSGQTRTLTRQGTCFIYNSDDVLTDRDPCTQEATVGRDAALTAVHIWPSGARTVVQTAGLETTINGKPAFNWYWPDPRPDGAANDCPRSEASRNIFCFHPD